MGIGLPWFKVVSNAAAHPKVRDLRRILKVPLADAYVFRLWCFAAEFASDGYVYPYDVEDTCKWSGEPGDLVKTMLLVGLLDDPTKDSPATVARLSCDYSATVAENAENEVNRGSRDGKLFVHDWDEINGAHAEKLAKDAERMRDKRAKSAKERTAAAKSGDVYPEQQSRDRRGTGPATVARRVEKSRADKKSAARGVLAGDGSRYCMDRSALESWAASVDIPAETVAAMDDATLAELHRSSAKASP